MDPSFSSSVQSWRARGRFLELAGLEVFVIDTGTREAPLENPTGPADQRDPVVILHGFPSSSHDWNGVLPGLEVGGRVILLDFPGFGLSAKPEEYSYSLFEQADLVEMVIRTLGVEAAHLVAHDMGTSIAAELVARHERGLLGFRLRSLTLMNGSVHIALAHLTPSQKVLRTPLGPLFSRVASYRVFQAQLKRILGRQIDEEALRDMWDQLSYRDGQRRLPQTIAYIDERWRFHRRWVGALTCIDRPTLVLWGQKDPVAVEAIAERLAAEIPGARLEWLPELGHYPQLEDPETVRAALGRFFDAIPAGT